MKTIKSIMSRNVEVVSPDAVLTEVAEKMKLENTGVLPVCDGNKIRGMITDRDIVIRAIADGKDPAEIKASDVMSRGVHYLFEDDDLDEAISLMRSKRVHRIVVLDKDKKLSGILSFSDFGLGTGEEDFGSSHLAAWSSLALGGLLAGLGYYFYRQGTFDEIDLKELISKYRGKAA